MQIDNEKYNDINNIKRGDVWLVDLEYGKGSEQGGIRPCLIVQNNVGNKYSPTVIICPVTTQKRTFNTTHVKINSLKEPSLVLCEQIRVIDKVRLKSYINTLTADEMTSVDKKIKIALGLGGIK